MAQGDGMKMRDVVIKNEPIQLYKILKFEDEARVAFKTVRRAGLQWR